MIVDGGLAPGLSFPSRSAASIIDRPMRSLIEPVGFWFSSLTNSRHGPVSSCRTSTSGVLPMVSRMDRPAGMAPPVILLGRIIREPATLKPMNADAANLIWIDLEMTGLVPERHRIIEIATVVTD